MILNTQIAREYLCGGNPARHRGDWFYQNFENVQSPDGSIFTEPDPSDARKQEVKKVLDILERAADSFEPLNPDIWNTLFPEWRSTVRSVSVDLIVGFPKPYDAVAKYDAEGNAHVIFDLCCWAGYLKSYNIEKLAKGLLTHELFHVLIADKYPELQEDGNEINYLTALDAVTFNEGFAHLVSYEDQEINDADWNSEKIRKVWEKSIVQLKNAAVCKIPEQQRMYLFHANCGKYYEKFAAMAGMIYLARIWEHEGTAGLKKIMDDGYEGFAGKCCESEWANTDGPL